MFTTINQIENKNLVVLIQGDSYMEQLTFSPEPKNISVKLIQDFGDKKNVGL